tara:strand:- start:1371 stop:1559 length:189 start_codon:yes stop_codon:yes gene_type:complete
MKRIYAELDGEILILPMEKAMEILTPLLESSLRVSQMAPFYHFEMKPIVDEFKVVSPQQEAP